MKLRRLVTVPVYIIGASTCILGLGWFLSPEPWLLDQRANEIILQTSFAQLLAADVNTNLGAYLTVIYRFFGWWVFSIGILILAYAFATKLETKRSRNIFYSVMSFIVIVVYIMELRFIPVSPFLWAAYGLAAMILVSFIASTRLPSSGS